MLPASSTPLQQLQLEGLSGPAVSQAVYQFELLSNSAAAATRAFVVAVAAGEAEVAAGI